MNVDNVVNLSKEPPKKNNFKNSAIASMAGGLSSLAGAGLGWGVMNQMGKIGNLPQDTIEIIKKAVDNSLVETGLDKKGVEIVRKAEYPSTAKGIEKFIEMQHPVRAVEMGKNAFYLPNDKDALKLGLKKGNKIILPENKISYAGFHEVGHAMNKNLSKMGKVLQKCRPLFIASSIISLVGAFGNTKKAQEGKELSFKDKTVNFIRENAGKLTLAAFVPMLAEEAMATKNGLKLAKKSLSPEIFKTVAKGNKVAYLSYMATALCATVAAWATVKVKDTLMQPKK